MVSSYNIKVTKVTDLNNYAISSDGIATALQDSASSLMAANNSYQEAVALIAAANRVVQDPNSVGAALRTISLRLRGTSTKELEEAGEDTTGVVTSKSKLRTKIQGYTGIDILTDSGAYKSTYEILLEISKVWDDLTDQDRAGLLELIAGKTRSNTAAAILSNTKDLEAAYQSAMEAEGSAYRENEKYLESIQGHIDLFNNAVQTMWQNTLDSDAIKWFVHLGKALVELIDKFGLIKSLVVGIGTYLITKHFKGDLFGGLFGDKTQGIPQMKKTLEALKTARDDAEAALTQSPNSKRAQRKFTRAQSTYDTYEQSVSPKIKEYDELNDKLKMAQSNLDKYQKRLDNYKGTNAKTIKQYTNNVNKAQKEVNTLESELKQLEVQTNVTGNSGLTLGQKFAAGAKTATAAIWKFGKQIAKSFLTMYAITTLFSALLELGDRLVGWMKNIGESAEEAQDKLEDLNNELSNTTSELNNLETELDNTKTKFNDLISMGTLSLSDQEELDRLKAHTQELERQIALKKQLQENLQKGANSAAINATDKYLDTSFGSEKTKSERQEEAADNWGVWGDIIGAGLILGGLALAPFSGGTSTAISMLGAGMISTGLFSGKLFRGIGSNLEASKYDKEQSVEEAIKNMATDRANLEKTRDEAYKAYTKAPEDKKLKQTYEDAESELSQYDETMAKHISQIQENYNAIDLETATPHQKAKHEEYADLLDRYNIVMGGSNAKTNAIERIFGYDRYQDVFKRLNELSEQYQKTKDQTILSQISEEAQKAINDLNDVGLSIKDIVDYFTEIKGGYDPRTIGGVLKILEAGEKILKQYGKHQEQLSDEEKQKRDSYVKQNAFATKKSEPKIKSFEQYVKETEKAKTEAALKMFNLPTEADTKADAKKVEKKAEAYVEAYEKQAKSEIKPFEQYVEETEKAKAESTSKMFQQKAEAEAKVKADADKKKAEAEAKVKADADKAKTKEEEKKAKEEKKQAEKEKKKVKKAAKAAVKTTLKASKNMEAAEAKAASTMASNMSKEAEEYETASTDAYIDGIKSGTSLYSDELKRPDFQGKLHAELEYYQMRGATDCMKFATSMAQDMLYEDFGNTDAFTTKYLQTAGDYMHGAKTFAYQLYNNWGQSLGIGSVPRVQYKRGDKINRNYIKRGTLGVWSESDYTQATMDKELYGSNYYGHAFVIRNVHDSGDPDNPIIEWAHDLSDTTIMTPLNEFEQLGVVSHMVTPEMALKNQENIDKGVDDPIDWMKKAYGISVKDKIINRSVGLFGGKASDILHKFRHSSQYEGGLSRIERRQNRDEMYKFFKSKGLTDKQTAAIIGNLAHESNYETSLFNSAGEVYGGIAQWRGDRFQRLLDRAGPNASLQDQLEYMWWELTQGGYAPVLAEMTDDKSLDELTEIFRKKYEGGGKTPLRQQYAQDVIDLYGSDPKKREAVLKREDKRISYGDNPSYLSRRFGVPANVIETLYMRDGYLTDLDGLKARAEKIAKTDANIKAKLKDAWDAVVNFFTPTAEAAELTPEQRMEMESYSQQQAQVEAEKKKAIEVEKASREAKKNAYADIQQVKIEANAKAAVEETSKMVEGVSKESKINRLKQQIADYQNIEFESYGFKDFNLPTLTEDEVKDYMKKVKEPVLSDINPYLLGQLTGTDFGHDVEHKIVGKFVAGQNEKAKQAFEYFKGKGLSDKVAAAIVGNLQHEGNWNTDLFTDTGEIYGGIAQWRDYGGPRFSNLVSKYGPDATLEEQLDYVWSELQSKDYSHILPQMTDDKDLLELGTIFSKGYEGPRQAMSAKRALDIKDVYNKFTTDAKELVSQENDILDSYIDENYISDTANSVKSIWNTVWDKFVNFWMPTAEAAELSPEQRAAIEGSTQQQVEQAQDIVEDTVNEQISTSSIQVDNEDLQNRITESFYDGIRQKQAQSQAFLDASNDIRENMEEVQANKEYIQDQFLKPFLMPIENAMQENIKKAQDGYDELNQWYDSLDENKKNIFYQLALEVDTTTWDLDTWKEKVSEEFLSQTQLGVDEAGEAITWDNLFKEEDGKMVADDIKVAEILKGADQDLHDAFVNIIEDVENGKIGIEEALSKWSLAGIDKITDVLNNEFEDLNNELFPDAADEISGLIDSLDELKAAFESVASTMDIFKTAQEEMNKIGRVSIKTALELMGKTSDWDKILNITDSTITLVAGSEQELMELQLQSITEQLKQASELAQYKYQTALEAKAAAESFEAEKQATDDLNDSEKDVMDTQNEANAVTNERAQQVDNLGTQTDQTAQSEMDYANNKDAVVSAEGAKAKAIGLASSMIIALDAALQAFNDGSKKGNWGAAVEAFYDTYTKAKEEVLGGYDVEKLKKDADDKDKLYKIAQQGDTYNEFSKNYNSDKDSDDRLANLQKKYSGKISNLENQKTWLENEISREEEIGIGVSKAYYEEQIKLNDKLADQYEAQRKDLIELQKVYPKGSEEWYEVSEAIWEMDHAIQELTVDSIQASKAIIDLYTDAFDKIGEAFSDKSNISEQLIASMEGYVELLDLRGDTATKGLYDAMIAEYDTQLETKWNQFNSQYALYEDLVAKRDGYTPDSADWIYYNQQVVATHANLMNVKDEIQGIEIAQEQKREEFKELATQRWDDVQAAYANRDQYYQNQIDLNDKYIEKLETLGINVPDEAYQAQIDSIEAASASKWEQYLQARQEMLDYEGIYGADSQEYIDKYNETIQLHHEYLDYENQILAKQQQIFDNQIDRFNQVIDRINNATQRMSNISGLLDREDVATEDGEWTSEGLTRLGMAYQQMEYYKQSADEIAEKMEEVEQAYKRGEISEKKYYETMQELENQQWSAINSYEDMKDTIIDLNEARIDMIEDGLNKEAEAYQELIELKKEELDAERDLYDFKKNIEKQTKDIAALERRIASMSGSTDAATIAERTKLEAELREAREGLDDTYYGHAMDSQSKALDDELDAYTKSSDDYIESLRESIKDTNLLIEETYTKVVQGSSTVLETIYTLSETYKFPIDQNLTDPWENATQKSLDFETYAESHILGIYNYVESMKGSLAASLGEPYTSRSVDAEGNPLYEFSLYAAEQIDKVIDDNVSEQQRMKESLDGGFTQAQSSIQGWGTTAETAVQNVINKFIDPETGLLAALSETTQRAKEAKAAIDSMPNYDGGYIDQKKTSDDTKKKTDDKITTNPVVQGAVDAITSAAVVKTPKTSGKLNSSSYSVSGLSSLSWGQDDFTITMDGKTYDVALYSNAIKTTADQLNKLFNGKLPASGTLAMLDKKLYAVGKGSHAGWNLVGDKNDGKAATTAFYNKLNSYAKGTMGTSRDQWAITDESWIGDEITLGAGKSGHLQYLKKGSAVLPSDISENLVEWGKLNPDEINVSNGVSLIQSKSSESENEFNFNIDGSTQSNIQAFGNKGVDYIEGLQVSVKDTDELIQATIKDVVQDSNSAISDLTNKQSIFERSNLTSIQNIDSIINETIRGVVGNSDVAFKTIYGLTDTYKTPMDTNLTTPWINASQESSDFALDAQTNYAGVERYASIHKTSLETELRAPFNNATGSISDFSIKGSTAVDVLKDKFTNANSGLIKVLNDTTQAAKNTRDAIESIGSYNSNDGGNDMIKIAEKYVGQSNAGGKFSDGRIEAWCADFVSYVAEQAGVDDIPQTASVASMYNYFKKNGRLSSTPSIGSIVMFDWGDGGSIYDHVGIVTGYDDQYIYTIEGNTSGGKVAKKTRSRNKNILGYGTYAKGTLGTTHDQFAFTDESWIGEEITLAAGKNGQLQYLKKGSAVMPADISANLVEWGKLNPNMMNVGGGVNLNMISNAVTKPELNFAFDSLVHVDNCSQDTLKDLEKMVDTKINQFNKQLNQSLRKFK